MDGATPAPVPGMADSWLEVDQGFSERLAAADDSSKHIQPLTGVCELAVHVAMHSVTCMYLGKHICASMHYTFTHFYIYIGL